jgi:phenylalanyl-tRNA synthetase beta chain
MPYVVPEWLGEHVELPADLTPEELAEALVRVGLEEEAIHGAEITGPVVVGRVVAMNPEPQKNGKTINWCQVDVGELGAVEGAGTPDERVVPRGIVCGAHNFTVGDEVVVSLPGAVLPGGFAIASRKTYGHVSDGMICSAKELGLGDDHDGIIVLSRLGHDGAELVPGADALVLLGLDHRVLEINVTPDRGYCFSYRGVAREYAHSTGATFTDPGVAASLAAPLPSATPDGFPVEVRDDAPVHGQVGCDRFVTRVVRGIDPAAASPAWLQRRLTQSGMRPISLTVDVTNYVMLDLGQPLHAYDLTRVAAPIVVRRAHPGEHLVTLDDIDRTLAVEDLLITDSPALADGDAGTRILGLAGVMGGASSEVTGTTTDVLIEAAHFDPVTIARSARRHKLPSEASKRFERGVDPRIAAVAAQRVVDLLVRLGGGEADDAVSDLDRTTAPAPIRFSLAEAERLVGVAYPPERVTGLLTEIGCTVAPLAGDPGVVDVTPPTWRGDVASPADLVEEVARLDGYDEIPSILPTAPAGTGLTRAQKGRRSIARALAEAGLVEVLSYPFVSVGQLDDLGLPADDPRRTAVRLANPLSDEQNLMRTNLLVTLLATARRNVGRGSTDLAIFETGLVTLPRPAAPRAPSLPGGVRPTGEALEALAAATPPQPRRVAGVLAGAHDPAGWWGDGRPVEWSDAVSAARLVAESLRAPLTVTTDTDHLPWHPGRCARIELEDGRVVGYAGELHPQVLETLGLPARTAAFEVDVDVLLSAAPTEPVEAHPVSSFPLAKEDVALVVDAEVPAEAVRAAIVVGAGDVLEDLRLFDVYSGPQLGDGKKSLAFSLRLRAADRTLAAEETAAVRDRVVEAAAVLGATLRA